MPLPRPLFRWRPLRLAALLSAGLALTSTAPLAAQGNPGATESAKPFWWGLSVGGASARLACDICQPGRDLGAALDASFGAYASERLRVGIEAGGWTHDDPTARVRESVYRAGVVGLLTPAGWRGAMLIGGVGWAGYRADNFRYDAPRMTLGAGWEQTLGVGWRVGNQLTFDGAAFGSLKNRDTTVARRVGLSAVRLTVHLRRG